MSWRNTCQESEPPDALAERPVAEIGAAPLPFHGEGAAHNRLSVSVPCGAFRSARPTYDRENQVRALAGEPRLGTAGAVAVGAATAPSITTPGLVPDAMTVRWSIAKLALRFHRRDRSLTMDWSHAAFSEAGCRP
jgi:hypothetical protein